MNHTALRTAGPYAQDIAQLFWVYTGVAAVVYLLVIGALVYAVWRRARRVSPEAAPRKALAAIGVSLGVTGIVLVAWALADFYTHRSLEQVPPDALRVRVTAHQWWWEIEYLDAVTSDRIITANQMTLPVGWAVALELQSDDVIHSFWVPSLNGKRDLMPGYTTRLALIAARAGAYLGECAEFCGYQHAHMSLDVAAVSPQEFEQWREAQRGPAAQPQDDVQRHGRDVFLGSTCRGCHAIQGTEAGARLGPDLTHLASRPRIAAGTLPNNASNLAAWIADPQAIKPGTRMPATQLTAEDLSALTAYLGNLK